MSTFVPPRFDPARRTDGTVYQSNHPQYQGRGQTQSCTKCGQHKTLGPGWKPHRICGKVCPQCQGISK